MIRLSTLLLAPPVGERFSFSRLPVGVVGVGVNAA